MYLELLLFSFCSSVIYSFWRLKIKLKIKKNTIIIIAILNIKLNIFPIFIAPNRFSTPENKFANILSADASKHITIPTTMNTINNEVISFFIFSLFILRFSFLNSFAVSPCIWYSFFISCNTSFYKIKHITYIIL